MSAIARCMPLITRCPPSCPLSPDVCFPSLDVHPTTPSCDSGAIDRSSAAGYVVRFKARWVVRGDMQLKGLDYEQSWAPVIKGDSIRALLILATAENLDISGIDVKTAFLYSNLSTETFVNPPEGYRDEHTQVCKLHKAIYGLVQGAKEWYDDVKKKLSLLGFKRTKLDYAVWINPNTSLIVGCHVDDILMVGKTNAIDAFKKDIAEFYEFSDLADISIYVGWHFTRDREKRTLRIDQTHYITQLLEDFDMSKCNNVQAPMKLKQDSLETTPFHDIPLYQKLVGCLNYLANNSRPDIAHAINHLAPNNY